jgi:hypothetical protein
MSVREGDSTRAVDRVQASYRSGDLDDLWPDFTAAQRRAASKQIRAVVMDVLAGSERPAFANLGATEARCIGVAAFAAGMGPLLGYWIERGVIEASEPVRTVLGEHLEQGARRIAMLRQRVAAVVRAMREAGVDPILLKGMHLGAEYFPHPSTRTASDIDFLLHPLDAGKAATVLSGMGFTETVRSSFGRRSTWTHPTASRIPHSIEMDVVDNPWTIDLLVALERWYFRGTRRDLGNAVFDTTRRVEVESESVRVLDQPYLAAFLALHASSHLRSMQMVRLLELVWVIRRDHASGRLSFEELDSLFERTDTGRFVYPALALADELAPGTVDPVLLNRLAKETSARMHRVLDRIRNEELGPLNERTPDVVLAWAVGFRESAWNVLEMVVPSDDAMGSAWSVFRRRLGMVLNRSRTGLVSRLGRGPRANQIRAHPEAEDIE